MPQKGQKTITLSSKNIPPLIIKLVEDYDQSLASLTTYCIWLQFGTPKQRAKARRILDRFVK